MVDSCRHMSQRNLPPTTTVVGRAGHMFRVCEIADRAPGMLDPVACRPVRMVQARSADSDARVGFERLACAEFSPTELGSHAFARNRQARLGQHPREDRLERTVALLQMPRPEAQTTGGVKQGHEMIPAPDVIVMGVAEEKVGVERWRALDGQRVGEGEEGWA